jgi:hypothetical protein
MYLRIDNVLEIDPCTPIHKDNPSLYMMADWIIAEWFRRLQDNEEDPLQILDAIVNNYGHSYQNGLTGGTFLSLWESSFALGP